MGWVTSVYYYFKYDIFKFEYNPEYIVLESQNLDSNNFNKKYGTDDTIEYVRYLFGEDVS